MNKTTLILLGVMILLIAGNVYQYQNPKVVEVPGEQTAIDSTAWVSRAALTDQKVINDSLEAQNEKLAERVRKAGDEIASYTRIVGRLKTQVDSLEEAPWNAIPLTDRLVARDSAAIADTTFTRSKLFGDGLFRVTGRVDVKYTSSQLQVRQDFFLDQVRNVRLDVTTTVSDDQGRVLVYVTSQDFEKLKYESFTEFKSKTKLPWFWIGLGIGGGAVLLLN